MDNDDLAMNATGNTTIVSTLDRDSAVLLRNVFIVRLASVFVSLGWVFGLGLAVLFFGLITSLEQCC